MDINESYLSIYKFKKKSYLLKHLNTSNILAVKRLYFLNLNIKLFKRIKLN